MLCSVRFGEYFRLSCSVKVSLCASCLIRALWFWPMAADCLLQRRVFLCSCFSLSESQLLSPYFQVLSTHPLLSRLLRGWNTRSLSFTKRIFLLISTCYDYFLCDILRTVSAFLQFHSSPLSPVCFFVFFLKKFSRSVTEQRHVSLWLHVTQSAGS